MTFAFFKWSSWIVGWVLITMTAACESQTGSDSPAPPNAAIPAEFKLGEQKFVAHCSACHGQRGGGTGQGPPLVHKIYEPSHHADVAFQRAALNGVRAHHWDFGNMPKIEGVTSEDVVLITQYIRWLQRQAGIH